MCFNPGISAIVGTVMSFLRFSVQAFFFGGTDSINSLQPGLDDFFPIDLKFQHGRLDYPSGYAIHNIHIHTQLLNTKDNLENLDIIYILYRFIMIYIYIDRCYLSIIFRYNIYIKYYKILIMMYT